MNPLLTRANPGGWVPSAPFSFVTTLHSFRVRSQRPLHQLLASLQNCVAASPWKPLCECPSCVRLSGTRPSWAGSGEPEGLLIDGYRLQGAPSSADEVAEGRGRLRWGSLEATIGGDKAASGARGAQLLGQC